MNKIYFDINEENRCVKIMLDDRVIGTIDIKSTSKTSYAIIKYASMFSSTEIWITLNDDIHKSIKENQLKVGSYTTKQKVSAFNNDNVNAETLYVYGSYTECYYEVITIYIYENKINIYIESTEDIGYGADICKTNVNEEINMYGVYGEIHDTYSISDIKERYTDD